MTVLSTMAHTSIAWVTELLSRNSYLGVKILGASYVAYKAWRIIYLLHFAPLSKIPGSWFCKVSKFQCHYNTFFGRLPDTCEEDYYKYGDICVLGPKAVMISNPADCKMVLGTHKFRKNNAYKGLAVIAETMFSTQSGEFSHMRRRQVGHAFNHTYVGAMEPTIIECGIQSIRDKWDSYLDQSSSGEALVPYGLHFSLTSFDIIGALAYGERFDTLKNNTSKVVQWVSNYNALGLVRTVFKTTDWFPLNLIIKPLEKSRDEFVAFGNAAADRRRNLLKSGRLAEKPKDLLQALIDAEDPQSRVRMTQTQITAENIGFLVGGTDTTSLTLSWTLHYLLLYPDVYKRAVQEVRSKFSREHTITYTEGKAQLPYIDACIFESMRIRSVSGVFLPRMVPEEGATIQGHYLPRGTQIGVNIAGAHHHKETWEEPRKFMPERFLGAGEKKKQSVITFSSGVRICPGRNLAQYEMMTIFANLLKDYDFELPPTSLFRPDRVDKDGYPIAMPRTHGLTVLPKYPDRDCLAIIRRAPEASFATEK
ncbi:hypothetical protein IW140_005817 [Coemansia sp. RSA 1813]|nr:hypothetical protein EV178_003902 [Coemansia sp. RSA 1646]KAJ1770449.1 hypothetical protein LPJ74_003184 [Coemansia sp. RSA 1843]KAJ2090241.1 hypothetical protein IW138_002873 [Coemansia sp. RSA 986]KAJ2212577.1 hypothetical protein EV179_004559 [Coemansia sp. RSA 487]KAJ2564259.1 hypothetical protein IW140_005817 [Coemansia sp. RSA 1813]